MSDVWYRLYLIYFIAHSILAVWAIPNFDNGHQYRFILITFIIGAMAVPAIFSLFADFSEPMYYKG